MPTQSATQRFDRTALVFWALVGVCLGCARATPPEGDWFDACCETCSKDHCEGCTEAKGECSGKVGDREAECMVHNNMMMCRPEPPN